MKPYKTLIFILLVFAILAIVCVVFPTDGIKIGDTNLRFASIEGVLTGNSVNSVDVDSLEQKRLEHEQKIKNLRGLYDTIMFYKDYVKDVNASFSLPQNNIHYFDAFFEKASKAQSANTTVRILHYGDSQIEMDRMSDVLRAYMQETFGGGGVGLIPFQQTIPSQSVSQSASGNITLYSSYGEQPRNNGNYGPMAKCCRLAGSATCNISATNIKRCDDHLRQFSKIKILFNNIAGSFNVNFSAEGISEQTVCDDYGVHSISWNLGKQVSSIRISVSGTADIYGIMVDDGSGVAVDNISMRGASGHQISMIDKSQQQASYQDMNVGMVILQYGGNSVPYLKSKTSIQTYANALAEQITRIKETCPKATIVLVGPADMCGSENGSIQSYSHLPQIVDALRKMALENGVAYWSMYDVMGGQNSMLSWVDKGWAGADYLHYSQTGADKMAGYLVDAFDKMYELYKIDKRIGTKDFNKLWREASK